jgi:hypothetical protein
VRDVRIKPGLGRVKRFLPSLPPPLTLTRVVVDMPDGDGGWKIWAFWWEQYGATYRIAEWPRPPFRITRWCGDEIIERTLVDR